MTSVASYVAYFSVKGYADLVAHGALFPSTKMKLFWQLILQRLESFQHLSFWLISSRSLTKLTALSITAILNETMKHSRTNHAIYRNYFKIFPIHSLLCMVDLTYNIRYLSTYVDLFLLIYLAGDSYFQNGFQFAYLKQLFFSLPGVSQIYSYKNFCDGDSWLFSTVHFRLPF